MRNQPPNKKISSLELEDQNWFPKYLRAYQTDLLGAFAKALNLYEPARTFLSKKLKPGQTVVDLASGSGIPALLAVNGLNVSLKLCDKFPEMTQVKFMSHQEETEYIGDSIDVLEDVLPNGDCYTVFNGLHHFTPSEISIILQKAKSTNTPIYFFEPISPKFLVFLKVALATLILPLFLVPFIKPFRWDRLIFTYLIPLGILATFWDGMVSVGKSYSLSKIDKMKPFLASKEILISHGTLTGKFTNLTYIGLEL